MVETAPEASPADPGPLAESIAIMARLRAPGGCAWDREQTFESIQRHTLEETYEVFDAIDRKDWPHLQDELGDLLLQVLFYAQMACEAGHFDIHDVAAGLNAKLIRRHPHVFAGVEATDSSAVLRNWELIKQSERAAAPPRTSLLDSIPRSMPAVLEASRLGSQAAKIGFDWPDAGGVFTKLQEEIAELHQALHEQSSGSPAGAATPSSVPTPEVEGEVGDLLFTVVHLARHLKVDPETALRGTNTRFRRRFTRMESSAGGPEAFAALPPHRQEALWSAAKQAEAAEPR